MQHGAMRYAAYGSNLHPLRLYERTSSARLVGIGHLPNWSLRFHKRSKDDSGKCSIAAGDNGVYFAIFDLSAADKLTLDQIEGLGVGYAEISLSIPDFGSCVSYIAEESYVDDALQPYDWYMELVLAGARFHDFPDHYIRPIESIQAILDPNPERRARNWQTVELVKAWPSKHSVPA